MIIEILSPATIENDQVLKRRVYVAAGVPEYWIVDPFEHIVTQLIRGSRGGYVSLNLSQVW